MLSWRLPLKAAMMLLQMMMKMATEPIADRGICL
jgi:hypothetical protein